jgi:hypothetical protein
MVFSGNGRKRNKRKEGKRMHKGDIVISWK